MSDMFDCSDCTQLGNHSIGYFLIWSANQGHETLIRDSERLLIMGSQIENFNVQRDNQLDFANVRARLVQIVHMK